MEIEMKNIVQRRIEEMKDDLHTLSAAIWSRPELGNEECHAHRMMVDFFNKEGWLVEEHHHLETAFRAECGPFGSDRGEPWVTMGFVCEYDAEPGIGHACGHNLIAEVGAAVAVALKAAIRCRTDLPAPVKIVVIGTPAEESTGGKIELLKAGAFADIDVIFMARPGTVDFSFMPMDALTEVEVEFRGKAAHAGVSPWEGVNALDAAVVAYNNMSLLRQQLKPDWRIHGVINAEKVKASRVPDRVFMHYSIRAPKLSDFEVLKTKVEACFEAAAKATGCEMTLKYPYNTFSDILPNATLGRLYEKNGTSLGIKFLSTPPTLNQLGATDFGNVSYMIPAIHSFFGIGTTAVPYDPAFTEAAGSDLAQMLTLKTAKTLAMTAVDVVASADMLAQVRDDFAVVKKRDQWAIKM